MITKRGKFDKIIGNDLFIGKGLQNILNVQEVVTNFVKLLHKMGH